LIHSNEGDIQLYGFRNLIWKYFADTELLEECVKLMLKANYEIPEEKLFEKYNCEGIEFEGLLEISNALAPPQQLNKSLIEKFDIDFIERDTKGREDFNAKKHIETYNRKFKRMWVKFQQLKMASIDKKLNLALVGSKNDQLKKPKDQKFVKFASQKTLEKESLKISKQKKGNF
jgi:hypothetical protein